ncbi:FAD:protein FMN transferase [Candidatus Gracilibacteria bacterium]|jgi:thiamine biosynthesis lipoprotein|nr:FAD:protein FMN transferase [Candidatus Gracilibacteria bacterium]
MQLLAESAEILGSQIIVNLAVSEDDLIQNSARIKDFFESCFAECRRLEQAYSRFLPTSQLSRVNNNLGNWQQIDAEFLAMLRFAKSMHKATNGYFDITIKSILDALGYDANYSFAPKAKLGQLGNFELALKNPDWGDELHLIEDFPEILSIDPQQFLGYQCFVKTSAELDLGGFGKGYALDLMVNLAHDFPNVLLDAGGDIYARGLGPDGEHWRIYLEDPNNPELALGLVQFEAASGGFLAASNPGKRNWGEAHHLVNPVLVTAEEQAKTNLASEIKGVFVQTAMSGALADAWATALYVMGKSQAESYASQATTYKAMIV